MKKRKDTQPKKRWLQWFIISKLKRHCSLATKFIVKPDIKATSYFLTQKKPTAKQAKWQNILVVFNFFMEYKFGKANIITNTLNQKSKLAPNTCLNFPLANHIKEGLEHDPQAERLVDIMRNRKNCQFWLKDRLLITKEDQVYVPK